MSVKGRVQARTIKKVVAELHRLGLSVYGQNTDLETGEELPGCRDYDADDVVKYRKLAEAGDLWYDESVFGG